MIPEVSALILGPKDTTKLLNCSIGLAPASVNKLRTNQKGYKILSLLQLLWKDQTEDGSCTVSGLDRRLDMELDVKSPYTAV